MSDRPSHAVYSLAGSLSARGVGSLQLLEGYMKFRRCKWLVPELEGAGRRLLYGRASRLESLEVSTLWQEPTAVQVCHASAVCDTGTRGARAEPDRQHFMYSTDPTAAIA